MALWSSSASAQPVKISGALVTNGSVGGEFAISPDGRYAVFIADKDVDQQNELYSVRLSNGAITNLTGGIVTGGDVSFFVISPDSEKVVFIADKDADGVFELYSTPIATGAPVKISGPVPGGSVSAQFKVSPDSTRVVFTTSGAPAELYSTPISSAAAVKISGSLVVGGGVQAGAVQISRDSANVVFIADKDTNGVFELYSTPIATGAPVKISGPLVSGGSVLQPFHLSPDSTRVVFSALKDSNQISELYSTPIASAAPVKISGPLVFGGDVEADSVQISPDSANVVFIADKDTDGVFELYSTPIATGAPVKISGSIVSGGDVLASGFSISPDSSRVVFAADKDTNDELELYSTPIATGAPVKISGSIVSGGDVVASGFSISPDSTRVVFMADKDTDEVIELYSTPIASGAPIKISGPLVSGGDLVLGLVEISPDSTRVVFVADKDTDGVRELYSTSIASATPVKISGPLTTGGDVTAFKVSADSARVIFRARKDSATVDELYRVQIGGAVLSLDFDLDDRVLPLTDLLMISRYQLGIRGAALIANALGENAATNNAATITNRIRAALSKPE